MNIKLRFTNGNMKRAATVELTDVPSETGAFRNILEQVHEFLTGAKPGGPAIITIDTSIKGLDPKELKKAVHESFQRVKGTLAEDRKPPQENSAGPNVSAAAIQTAGREITGIKAELERFENRNEPPEERPRQLPRIGSERTLGVNLGEMFPGLADLITEAADEEGMGKNIPGRSGIKFNEEGEPLLQVKYFCKDLNCQNSGLRYVWDGSAYCKCHNCNTKLKLRPANIEEPRHEKGYFFIADKLYIEGTNQ